ncbi:TetR family transcriptional regulator [bacterium]|nr:TetR family transcriptional regulator [bacterium]
MDINVSTLRERKKARTYDALVSSAMRLFLQDGYEKITVDDIAGAADVSRRTFFRYFPTKEAVVFPWRQDRLDRFREELSRRLPGEQDYDAVRRACLAMAGEYQNNREEMLEQHRVIESSATLIARERELDLEWEDSIADALLLTSPKTLRAKRQARVVAGAIIGMIRATLRDWFSGSCQTNLVRLGAEAFDLLEEGVSAAGHLNIDIPDTARAAGPEAKLS